MSQGFHIDILDSGESPHEDDQSARRWVGIRFECCGAYSRVYRNTDGTAYEGRCPRCLKQVRLRIGPEGTPARFFTAE